MPVFILEQTNFYIDNPLFGYETADEVTLTSQEILAIREMAQEDFDEVEKIKQGE